jgi:hypothetical protein
MLPALWQPQDSGLNAAINQMANAVARLPYKIEKEQPTLPSAKYNTLFSTVKSLLDIQEEAELPEFWFTLAAATKKQEFSIFPALLMPL